MMCPPLPLVRRCRRLTSVVIGFLFVVHVVTAVDTTRRITSSPPADDQPQSGRSDGADESRRQVPDKAAAASSSAEAAPGPTAPTPGSAAGVVTTNQPSADRRRRSTASLDDNDTEDNNNRMPSDAEVVVEDPMTRVRRRGRWSKNNVQIWGKRLSGSAAAEDDDDAVEGEEEDSRITNDAVELNGDQSRHVDDVVGHSSPSERKRAWGRNNFKIWGKRALSSSSSSSHHHRQRSSSSSSSPVDDYDEYFRMHVNGYPVRRHDVAALSSTRGRLPVDGDDRGGRIGTGAGPDQQPGSVDGAAAAARREQVLGGPRSSGLARQLFKRAANHQLLLGELLLKRLAAGKDQLGAWNGSQKGWASNNVRIWG